MFPDEVRNAMRLGTSSKWAADLTADDVQAVLWMVGEFGRRASNVLAALEQHWSEFPPQDEVASARAKLALEGLFRMVCGERPSVDEFIGRWHSISERVWAGAQSRLPELAAEEMGDKWPVAWEGRLVGWLKDPRHRLFGCTGLWVPSASPGSEQFAVALSQATQTPLVVSIGGVQSLVKQLPSQAGEVSVFWLGPNAEPAAAADRGRS